MTTDERIEAHLTAGLTDLAGTSTPGFRDDILMATARTRQRPAWTFIERWLPMTLIRTRGAAAPSAQAAWLLRPAILLLLLGLILALTTLGLAVGSRPSSLKAVTLPPPTGPAGNGLIAFDSGADIWVVNPDGSERRQLTTGPALEHSPVWSPDGTRLSFWSHEAVAGPSSLIVVNADGSDPLTIATSEAGYAPFAGGDWSPDGRHVAYSLCTVEADPEADCAERILVTATDGSGTSQVGDPTLNAFLPDWSPDGTMLAFQGSPWATDVGAYLMAADGSRVRRLGQIPAGGFNVTWSPDGTGVVTAAGDPMDIWFAAADGVGAVNLTNSPGNDRTPWWSPDGKWVQFDAQGRGFTVVSADGAQVRELGISRGGSTWSPDATALAAYRSLEGNGLVIIDAVTGEVLTEIEAPDQSFPGQAHYPSWQRVAP